jgi:hypothetical protein
VPVVTIKSKIKSVFQHQPGKNNAELPGCYIEIEGSPVSIFVGETNPGFVVGPLKVVLYQKDPEPVATEPQTETNPKPNEELENVVAQG